MAADIDVWTEAAQTEVGGGGKKGSEAVVMSSGKWVNESFMIHRARVYQHAAPPPVSG